MPWFEDGAVIQDKRCQIFHSTINQTGLIHAHNGTWRESRVHSFAPFHFLAFIGGRILGWCYITKEGNDLVLNAFTDVCSLCYIPGDMEGKIGRPPLDGKPFDSPPFFNELFFECSKIFCSSRLFVLGIAVSACTFLKQHTKTNKHNQF